MEDMMVNAIKELKRDIISGYTYRSIEMETNDISESISYRNETLLLEDGKIAYGCLEMDHNGEIRSGAGIIYGNSMDFLKEHIAEILNRINSAYYYLPMESEV